MKIKKMFFDRLTYTKLFRVLYIREQCFDFMQNHDDSIAYNLIKIHMYHKSNNVESWCEELNKSFLEIQNFIQSKSRYRNILLEDLIQYLWEHYLETPEEIRDRMMYIPNEESTVGLMIDDLNHKKIFKSLKIIMHRVCEDILEYNFRDIKNYLRV